jgi:hypothetical protein
MQNYKALKSAGKASVQKVEVVDSQEVKEVKYKDGDDMPIGSKVGDIKVYAEAKRSHEELQLVSKKYNPDTGESLDDVVLRYDLNVLAREIQRLKLDISNAQDLEADLEELEKDLKAL